MSKQTINEIIEAFSFRYNRKISQGAVVIALELKTEDALTDEKEIDFVKTIYDYILYKQARVQKPEIIPIIPGVSWLQKVENPEKEKDTSPCEPDTTSLHSSDYSLSEKEETLDTSSEEEEEKEEEKKFKVRSPEWFNSIGRKPDDKCLLHELNKLPNGDIREWKKWINQPPNTYASQQSRLSYVEKWSREGKTLGLDINDYIESKALNEDIKKSLKSGAVIQIGLKTSEEEVKTQNEIKALLDSDIGKITGYNLFAQYLPPRRTGDLPFIFIFNTEAEYELKQFTECINAFVKETQMFHWNVFKNVESYGVQSIPATDVEEISYCKLRFKKGMDYLNSIKSGTRLNKETANPTNFFKRQNGTFNCNNLRHFYQSVVGPTLNKNQNVKLNYWLAHSPSTGERFYRND